LRDLFANVGQLAKLQRSRKCGCTMRADWSTDTIRNLGMFGTVFARQDE
jgi:hypothetical protein